MRRLRRAHIVRTAVVAGVAVAAAAGSLLVASRDPAHAPVPGTPTATATPVAAVLTIMPGRAPVPGATDPAVTQATIQQTICVSGYTRTVRPPSSYTSALKVQQMQQFMLPGKPSDYEEDHLIPLELGGAPRDPANLWPEAYAGPDGARTKDRLETALKRAVCAGRMTLMAAQDCIRVDWIACAARGVP